jgi:predicted transcriptional regulator
MDVNQAEYRTLKEVANTAITVNDRLLAELRRKRMETELSIEDIAYRIGVSETTVADIEEGNHDPHLTELRGYALALECFITHQVTPFTED